MNTTAPASAGLEDTLDLYFGQKAPSMPDNVKELLVRFAPWVTLVLLLITLPAVLIALGLGALAAPLAFLIGPGYGVSYGVTYTLGMIILGVSVLLEALSIPGLFKRSRQGWRYAYYATLVGIAGNLIGLNITSAIVSALVGFYILFQIRPYYGKQPELART
jgi:hypothetical protein